MLDWLYYLEKSEEAVYTANPTGRPIVERFINGEEKYWQKDDIAPKRQKCKLILSDWSALGWDENTTARVKTSIKTVLDKGFQVWIWQQNTLIPLTLGDLNRLDDQSFRANMKANQAELSSELTQKGIAADEVKTLDYFNVKRLTAELTGEPEPSSARLLATNDLINYFKISQEHFVISPQTAMEQCVSIAVAECANAEGLLNNWLSQDAKELIRKVKQNYPEIKLIEHIDSIKISREPITKEDIETVNQCDPKRINIWEGSIEDERLKEWLKSSGRFSLLETIRLEGEWDKDHVNELQELLGKAKPSNLELCNFGTKTPITDEWVETHNEFATQLENLSLEAVLSEPTSLVKMLNQTTNLKKMEWKHLSLEPTSNPDDIEELLGQMSFDGLESFSLPMAFAPVHLLAQAVVKRSENLKNFKVSGYIEQEDALWSTHWFEQNPKAFQSLEELYLEGLGDNKEAVMLKAVALRAKKLTRLHLGYGESFKALSEDWCQQHPEALRSLEEFTSENTTFSLNDLARLASISPKLRKMSINNIKVDEDSYLNQENSLIRFKQLNELQVKYAHMPAQFLLDLLLPCEQLMTLDLTGAAIASDDPLAHPLDETTATLVCLEKLQASYSNITPSLLLRIIHQSSKLKTLNLSGVKNLNIAPEPFIEQWPLGTLNQLETIDLSDSNISLELFLHIIEHAPNVKSINLSHCEHLFENVSEDNLIRMSQALSNIEVLTLPKNNLDSHQLTKLYSHLIHIKNIHFDLNSRFKGLDQQIFDQHPQMFENVESISLTGMADSSETLTLLMQRASKVSSLNLNTEWSSRTWNNLTDWIDQNPGLFQELERFELPKNATPEFLLKILQSSPNLKYCFLRDCEKIGEALHLPWFAPYRHKIAVKPFNYNKTSSKPDGGSTEAGLQRHEQTQNVDADTENRDQDIATKQKFFRKNGNHPPPSYDRAQCWNTIEINEDTSSPFRQMNEGDLELISVDFKWRESAEKLVSDWKSHSSDDPIYSCCELDSLNRDWRPLPSLAPTEKMSEIHVEGFNESDVEIRYSLRDNQYYIRSNSDQLTTSVKVHSVLDLAYGEIGSEYKGLDQKDMPESLKELIKEYRNFSTGELRLDKEHPTGEDYLKAIQEQKLGACRHRAFAFKAHMQKNFPDFPVRIITNDLHAFVEINVDNKWHKVCLGGAPAKLHIENTNNPDSVKSQEPSEPKHAKASPPKSKRASSKQSALRNQFKTWETPSIKAISLENYTQNLLDDFKGQNALVELTSDSDVEQYRIYLEQTCQAQNRPIFYISDPDDINCSSKWVKRLEDDHGDIMPGPGGPLHDFLAKHKEQAPVIVVNWSNFEADDIARFNSLIDDNNRKADGTEVPEKAVIVGLYNIKRENAYKRSDFYGRFHNEHKSFPFSSEVLSQQPSPLDRFESEEAPNQANHHVIDLHSSPHWKQILLGHWQLKGQDLIFKPGKLEKALVKGGSIEIKNGPWHIPEFQRFWQQTFIHKEVSLPGKVVKLDDKIMLKRTSGYDFSQLNQALQWTSTASEPQVLLNPSTLGQFYQNHIFDPKTHTLSESQGIIKSNASKVLNVRLTRNISDDQWLQLLTKCAKHDVTLNIIPSLDVSLPKGIKTPEIDIDVDIALARGQTAEQVRIIETNDEDYVVDSLVEQEQAMVIDISEMDGYRLLESYDLEWVDDKQFLFKQRFGALWQALHDGQSVILKGDISDDLADKLAQLIFSDSIKGKESAEHLGTVTIISRDQSHLGKCCSNISNVTVTLEQKLEALKRKGFSQAILDALKLGIKNDANPSLTLLETYCKHLEKDITASFQEAWYGYSDLKVKRENSKEIQLSLEAAQAFDHQRHAKVEQALSDNPYVFLAGATGVGKSTYIKEKLSQEPGYTVHSSFDELHAWATSSGQSKTQILFIDEANLENTDYTLFEGLYNQPPSIIIDGEYHELTVNHKVIFAGNPLSYGAGRQLATFFERHGHAVVFDPLPPAYIYHQVLTPLFGNHYTEAQKKDLASVYLKVYDYVCSASYDTVLMTPREIEMMAMMTLSKPPEESLEAAFKAAYTIGRSVLPAQKLALFEKWFKKEFNCDVALADISQVPDEDIIIGLVDDFVLTPSRSQAYRVLNDIIDVRHFQQTTKMDSQKRAGLGGVILEGEPGDGKSHFAASFLRSKGFKPVAATPLDIQQAQGDVFCYLPASMTLSQKRECLLAAFHKGAVVIEDEINSCPSLEKLRNNLLMGLDEQGKPADKSGLKFIGTGNPIDFAGRRATSLALQRRTVKCDVPPYSTREMVAIIAHTCPRLSMETIHELVSDYETSRAYAIAHQKEPKPSFRRLLKVARLKENLNPQESSTVNSKPSSTISMPELVIANEQSSEQVIEVQPSLVPSSMSLEEQPLSATTTDFEMDNMQNSREEMRELELTKLPKTNNPSQQKPKAKPLMFSNAPEHPIERAIYRIAQNDPSLVELELKSSGIAKAFMQDIGKALPSNTHLAFLDISSNGLVDEPLFLKGLLENSHLKKLGIEIRHFSRDFQHDLMMACQMKHIQLVDEHGHDIDNSVYEQATCLDVTGIGYHTLSFDDQLNRLKSNDPTFIHADLRLLSLDEKKLAQFCDAMKTNTHLKTLNLAGYPEKDISLLYEGIIENTSLNSIYFDTSKTDLSRILNIKFACNDKGIRFIPVDDLYQKYDASRKKSNRASL